jgi:hypothetical protein
MLSSISPLGERARHNRWVVTVGWYVAASTVTAAAIGAALGALGGTLGVSGPARFAACAVAAVVAAGADASGHRLPGPRRQVNEDWLGRYRGWVYGAGFGAQLGAGVTTIVTSATVWLVLAAELMAGSAASGLAVGAAFGAVRALPLAASWRVRSHGMLLDAQRRLAAQAPVARRVTVAATVVAAAGWAVLAL